MSFIVPAIIYFIGFIFYAWRMTTLETPTPVPTIPSSFTPTVSLYSLCIQLLFACRSPGKGNQKKPIKDLCKEVDEAYNVANEGVYLQYIKDHSLYAKSKIQPLVNKAMKLHFGFSMKEEVSIPLRALMETLISLPADSPEFAAAQEVLETRISQLSDVSKRHKSKIISQAMIDAKSPPTAEETSKAATTVATSLAEVVIPTTPLPQLSTKTPVDYDSLNKAVAAAESDEDLLSELSQRTSIIQLADDDILEE
jgi:hypothetical protein